MVKRIVAILFVIIALGSINLYASGEGQSVDLEVGIIDPKPGHPGGAKTPVLVPDVFIDGHSLTFDNLCEDYTLSLYDEDDDLVYSVFVPAGTTQVVLPTTLSGTFEIRFETDTYYYYGYIDL